MLHCRRKKCGIPKIYTSETSCTIPRTGSCSSQSKIDLYCIALTDFYTISFDWFLTSFISYLCIFNFQVLVQSTMSARILPNTFITKLALTMSSEWAKRRHLCLQSDPLATLCQNTMVSSTNFLSDLGTCWGFAGDLLGTCWGLAGHMMGTS